MIDDDEFHALLCAVKMDPDSARTAVETFSVSKQFTAHQAASLVGTVQQVAPFETMEVAVLAHGRMLQPDSFQLVLNVLDTDADRDNVCHRLGIKADDARVTTRGLQPDAIRTTATPAELKAAAAAAVARSEAPLSEGGTRGSTAEAVAEAEAEEQAALQAALKAVAEMEAREKAAGGGGAGGGETGGGETGGGAEADGSPDAPVEAGPSE